MNNLSEAAQKRKDNFMQFFVVGESEVIPPQDKSTDDLLGELLTNNNDLLKRFEKIFNVCKEQAESEFIVFNIKQCQSITKELGKNKYAIYRAYPYLVGASQGIKIYEKAFADRIE